MNYQSRITDRKIIARELMVLNFEKPDGFDYSAGQFSFLVLPDIGLHDRPGLRRPLSFASSPSESELIITVRISESAFKTTLRELPVGSTVEFEKPVGVFVLPANAATPVVFLAGGIGVAPFRSMLRYSADIGTDHKATLFYSSREPEEALFLSELKEIAFTRPKIAVVATVTQADSVGENWMGLSGRISREMIETNCGEWADSLYYLSGPPLMVDGMQAMLDQMGIRRDRVKREVWTRYGKTA
jgi:ferredoxin-NADP reductase